MPDVDLKHNAFRNSLPSTAFKYDESDDSEAEISEDLSEEELKADLAWAEKLRNAEQEVEQHFGFMRKQTKRLNKGNSIDAKIKAILEHLMGQHANELKQAMRAAMDKAQEEAELEEALKEQGVDASLLPGGGREKTEDEKNFNKKKYGFMLHMDEETLHKYVFGFLPVLKIKDGTYMVGVNIRAVTEKANSILVRVGGGYSPLPTFIHENARQECFKIWHEMEKFGLSFEKTILTYLRKNKTDAKIIARFSKDCKDRDYAMFKEI